jgi:hypothetical protein
MKTQLKLLALAGFGLWLCGCASTDIKKSWKSPAYQAGQAQKIAVIAVDDRGLVRQGFENRFVADLRERGFGAITTFNLLGLPEIKADREAAAAKVREAGADSVLVVRLVDQTTYNHEVQATPALYVPTITGFDNYGWYDCYSVAFVSMGVVWGSSEQKIYLDTSLFDLKTGKRLWSALTMTVVKESDRDRLAILDSLITKVAEKLRQDSPAR